MRPGLQMFAACASIVLTTNSLMTIGTNAFEAPPTNAQPALPTGDTAFDLNFRTWVGYDSNVLLVPDAPPYFPGDGIVESAAAGLDVNFGLLMPLDPFNTIGGNLAISGVLYAAEQPAGVIADDPAAYNLVTFNPSAFYRRLLPLEVPTFLTLGYGFRTENGGGVHAIGLTSHQFNARVDMMPSDDWDFFASIDSSIDDFAVTFPDPDYERDGKHTSLSFGGRHSFNQQASSIGMSVGASQNDAEGANWDYTGFFAKVDLETHLTGPLHATLGASFEQRSYAGGFTDIVGAPGRTSESILEVEGALIYRIDETFTADTSVSWQSISGNLPEFSSGRWRLGAGLTAHFK